MNSELNFDGKKYISARRASEICGYSSDYIGQLCRKGSLDCRRVGRVWFVEEISLNSHQVEAAKKPRERIAIYQKHQKENEVATSPVITPVLEETIQAQPNEIFHFWGGAKDVSPSDYVDEVKDKAEASSFALKVGSGFATILVVIFLFPFIQNISLPTQHLALSQSISEKIVAPTLALLDIPTTPEKEAVLVANVFSNGTEFASEYFSHLPESIHNLKLHTHSITLRMYHTLSLATRATSDRMKKFARLSSGEKETHEVVDRSGIVVVPSTGSDEKDERVKKYIKDSFSDEVDVMLDGTGKSGAIKPEFRSGRDDKYIFVTVPVVDE